MYIASHIVKLEHTLLEKVHWGTALIESRLLSLGLAQRSDLIKGVRLVLVS